MHKSVATIDSPEFINLQPLDINPLMSSCEIKVFYLGENRNGTYIDKEAATKMAKTLRGAPIVGYYNTNKADFADHGEKIIIDDEGIHFECMTVPYGFVAPDAKVWFQKFQDEDDFGNDIEREYLMTTGYLWTGQFEECRVAVEEGRPHSMEIDGESVDGHWAENYKNGMEFFIINDATFSKLCILGDDVEPCFEGSSVKAPEVSLSFTKADEGFKETLQTMYTMMQDLHFALKGGQDMENIENKDVTPVVEEFSAVEDKVDLETSVENEDVTEGETSEVSEVPAEAPVEAETEFAKKDDEEEADKEDKDSESKEDEEDKDEKEEDDKEDEEDKDKKYSLLEAEYNELKNKYSLMESEYQALVAFKNEVEDKEKDALINRFYMLSDEDKADIIANKSTYSLNDIEAKLSILYTKQQLAIEENASETQEEKDATNVLTYNLTNELANAPDWVKAVREVQETMK